MFFQQVSTNPTYNVTDSIVTYSLLKNTIRQYDSNEKSYYSITKITLSILLIILIVSTNILLLVAISRVIKKKNADIAAHHQSKRLNNPNYCSFSTASADIIICLFSTPVFGLSYKNESLMSYIVKNVSNLNFLACKLDKYLLRE